ncbi:hypothetical protein HKD37_06G016399 [Glycine soja]
MHIIILLSLGDKRILEEASRENIVDKLWANLESESIHKHIDNFNRIVLSLRTIDVAVDDEDQLVLKRPITNLYGGGTSLGEGLMVRGRIEKREENFPKKALIEKLPGAQEDKANSSLYGGAVVALKESDVGNSNVNDDDWILDSAHTFHMMPNRDWFVKFQEIDGGKVLMENDTHTFHMMPNRDWLVKFQEIEGGKVLMENDGACSIVAEGTMQIKRLMTLGGTYQGEGGVLRISRGALIVETVEKWTIYLTRQHNHNSSCSFFYFKS